METKSFPFDQRSGDQKPASQGDWTLLRGWVMLPRTSSASYRHSGKVQLDIYKEEESLSRSFCCTPTKKAEKAKVPKKVDCEPSTLPLLYCQKYIGAIITIKVLTFWGNVSHHCSWKLEIDYVCIIFSTSFSFSLSISNRVVACYDDVKKGACRRQDCKFFHPPNHLKVLSSSTLLLTTWSHSF